MKQKDKNEIEIKVVHATKSVKAIAKEMQQATSKTESRS